MPWNNVRNPDDIARLEIERGDTSFEIGERVRTEYMRAADESHATRMEEAQAWAAKEYQAAYTHYLDAASYHYRGRPVPDDEPLTATLQQLGPFGEDIRGALGYTPQQPQTDFAETTAFVLDVRNRLAHAAPQLFEGRQHIAVGGIDDSWPPSVAAERHSGRVEDAGPEPFPER